GDAVGTLLVVEVNNGFGVAVRPEAVAPRDEPVAKVLEVVDLAVENNLHGRVFIGHRLAGVGAQVDDPQPPERQCAEPARRAVRSGAVGAPVLEAIAHLRQRLVPDGLAVEPQFTAKTAHSFVPCSEHAAASVPSTLR